MAPQEIHVLIPPICKYDTLYGRDFADVIKLRALRWNYYPGLSCGAQGNDKGPYEKEAQFSEREREGGRETERETDRQKEI